MLKAIFQVGTAAPTYLPARLERGPQKAASFSVFLDMQSWKRCGTGSKNDQGHKMPHEILEVQSQVKHQTVSWYMVSTPVDPLNIKL